jgi:hypothetical protein
LSATPTLFTPSYLTEKLHVLRKQHGRHTRAQTINACARQKTQTTRTHHFGHGQVSHVVDGVHNRHQCSHARRVGAQHLGEVLQQHGSTGQGNTKHAVGSGRRGCAGGGTGAEGTLSGVKATQWAPQAEQVREMGWGAVRAVLHGGAAYQGIVVREGERPGTQGRTHGRRQGCKRGCGGGGVP